MENIKALEERLNVLENEKLEIIDRIRLINKESLYNKMSAAINNVKNKYKDKVTIAYAYIYDYCPYEDYLGSYRYVARYTIHDDENSDEIFTYIAEIFYEDSLFLEDITFNERTSYNCVEYGQPPDSIETLVKDQRRLPELYDGYYLVKNEYRDEIWYKDGYTHYLINDGKVWSEI